MRRKTAKELLADSFRELAETKTIDKITIKEITENCGYSIATFYRQFRDKYDLIAWAYSRDLEQIMGQIAFDESSWKQTLTDAANYYGDHKEYLANLLLHTSGYDSFVRNMTEINFKSLKAKLLKSSKTQALDIKTEMLVSAYVFGSVLLTCGWILGQYTADAAVLAEIYDTVLPAPLKALLCQSV